MGGCCGSRDRSPNDGNVEEAPPEPPGTDEELDVDAGLFELPLVPPPLSELKKRYGQQDFDRFDPGIEYSDGEPHPQQKRTDGLMPEQVADARLRLRGPCFGGRVTALSRHPEGALYLVKDGKSWALYNDAPRHAMDVKVTFICKSTTRPHPRVRPLDDAKVVARRKCETTPYGGKANFEYEFVEIADTIMPGRTQRFCRCTVVNSFLGYTVDMRAVPDPPNFWRQVKKEADAVVERERELCFRLASPATVADPVLFVMTVALQNLPFVDYFFRPAMRALARSAADGVDEEAILVSLPDRHPLGRMRNAVSWQRPSQFRSRMVDHSSTALRYPVIATADAMELVKVYAELANDRYQKRRPAAVDFELALDEYYGYHNDKFQVPGRAVPAFVLPLPLRIDQGTIGTHWLSCSLAAVAEIPALISRLFVMAHQHTISNRFGAHMLNLCRDGWWTPIPLDDFFPCLGYGPIGAMSVIDRGELWPALVEKAYAKLTGKPGESGSYAAIRKGDALLGTVMLTGAPTCRFQTAWDAAARKEPEEVLVLPNGNVRYWRSQITSPEAHRMWQELVKLFLGLHPVHDPWEAPSVADEDLVAVDGRENIIMLDTRVLADFSPLQAQGPDGPRTESADTQFSRYVKRLHAAGLRPGHAYTVLDVKEFQRGDGSVVRMLKVRNPWPDVVTNRQVFASSPDVAKLADIRPCDVRLWAEEWGYVTEGRDADATWDKTDHNWDGVAVLDGGTGVSPITDFCEARALTQPAALASGTSNLLSTRHMSRHRSSSSPRHGNRTFQQRQHSESLDLPPAATHVNEPFLESEGTHTVTDLSESDEDAPPPLWAKEHATAAEERHSTFWVEFETALSLFAGGGACFVRSNMLDLRVRGSFLRRGTANFAVELRPKRDVTVMAVLTQRDVMGYRDDVRERVVTSRMTPSQASHTNGKVDPAAVLLPINLTVCRPDVNPGRMLAILSSSAHPSCPIRLDGEHHAGRRSSPAGPPQPAAFLQQREVAVEFAVPATDRPYLVAPRFRDDHLMHFDTQQLPTAEELQAPVREYVLTIMSTVPAEELGVRFVDLGPNASIYSDHHWFPYVPEKMTPVQAPVQARTRLGDDVTVPHAPETSRDKRPAWVSPKVGRS